MTIEIHDEIVSEIFTPTDPDTGKQWVFAQLKYFPRLSVFCAHGPGGHPGPWMLSSSEDAWEAARWRAETVRLKRRMA